MSIFRRNRLSDAQLGELLSTLPQVKAPENFGEQLDRMIALHSEHVPHMLGSMPMVPAPDDFDARLMEAIHDGHRPGALVPATLVSAGASINWINHLMGWIGGSLAVVVIAFAINQAGTSDQPTTHAPLMAPVMSKSIVTERASGTVGTANAATNSTEVGVAASPIMAEAPATTGAPQPTHVEHDIVIGDAPQQQQVAPQQVVVAPIVAQPEARSASGSVTIGLPETTTAPSQAQPQNVAPAQGLNHTENGTHQVDAHGSQAAGSNVSAGGDSSSTASEKDSVPSMEPIDTGGPARDDEQPK